VWACIPESCCRSRTRLHGTTRPTGHGCIASHNRYRQNTTQRKTKNHSNEHMDEKKDGSLTIKTHLTADPSCNSTKPPQLRQHLSAPSALEFILIASTGPAAVSVSCKWKKKEILNCPLLRMLSRREELPTHPGFCEKQP
jgi:hypothetical protein